MAAAPLRDRLREAFSRYLETPAIRFLVALGVSPDVLTVTGFTIAVGAACLAGAGLFLAAGLVFLAASVLDMLDGALARATDRVNAGGALLDSVTDRLSEGALLIGIGVNAALAGMSQSRLIATVVLLLSALLFSQMVSYIRARGEGLGIACKVGLMTRPERVMLLSLGLVLQGVGVDPSLLVTVGIVAGLSLTTMIQRFVHVRRQLRG
jgi:CDP-diacylglycerol--glycerol-3-phosphate 3-phosphatidyltransferase